MAAKTIANAVCRGIGRILRLMLLVWLAGLAQPAHAVQAHGGLEGLVSHELGHVLYIAGMVFMLFHVTMTASRTTAWRYFRWFLCLIILWNILTFSGHWMNEHISPDQMQGADGRTTAFLPANTFDVIYYLTRLDHILLVPALLFLWMSLKEWRTEQ